MLSRALEAVLSVALFRDCFAVAHRCGGGWPWKTATSPFCPPGGTVRSWHDRTRHQARQAEAARRGQRHGVGRPRCPGTGSQTGTPAARATAGPHSRTQSCANGEIQ